MKKKSKIILIVVLITLALIIGICITLFAVNWQPVNKVDLSSLEANENVSITYNEESDIPTIIAGDYTDFKVDSSNDAIKALEEVKDIMGINNPKEEYEVSNEIDFLENNIYRMQQYYKGIEVINRQMIIAADKEGNIKTLSGDYEKITDLDVNPNIDQNSAINTVTEQYGNNIQVDKTQLIIDIINDVPTLCWGVKAYGEFNELEGNSYNIYIDAKTGEIVKTTNTGYTSTVISKGLGTFGNELTFNTNKNWFNYEMYDPERKIEVRNYNSNLGGLYFSSSITSETNTWNDRVANTAMYNVSRIYDYYDLKFGIKSHTGKDDKIVVVVNDTGNNKNNAVFYSTLGGFISIGTGDETTYRNFVNGIDVLAHEFTHGYINYGDKGGFANEGFYLGEVNEAYADIMGNIIENYYREKDEVKSVNENENLTFENDKLWLIGENIVKEDQYGIRSMADPSIDNKPTTYEDENYISLTEDNLQDSDVVHNNCTVIENAFYKMWKNGLTTDEIAKIILESSNRLSRSSNYYTITHMIVELAKEYCPQKLDIVENALIESKLYIDDSEDEENSGDNNQQTSTEPNNLEDIYKNFIINKEYAKDEGENFGEATYYYILDINQDGTDELFIVDDGTGDFFSTLIYRYDSTNNKVVLIKDIYSYGVLRYSESDREIVYATFRPFKDAGVYDFYKLENNEFVWYKSTGYKGENFTDYYINTKENGETKISSEENSKIFESVENLDYKKISELMPKETENDGNTSVDKIEGLDDILEEVKKENIASGQISAGDYTLSYGSYVSSLEEFEMLGGVYTIRPDRTYTYRNIWKNYSGETKVVNVSGTYEVAYHDNLDIDLAGWAIEFKADSDEMMANEVWLINGNNSFEAVQYPNKFTLIQD